MRPSRRLAAYVVCVFLAASAAGCEGAALAGQARVGNAAALAANRGLDALIERYRAAGREAIAAAADRAGAEAALDGVRAAWAPVWGRCGVPADGDPASLACRGGAWQAARRAHDGWAAALERRADGTPVDAAEAARLAAQMSAAYCALRDALPRDARSALPVVPLVECPAAAPPEPPPPSSGGEASAPPHEKPRARAAAWYGHAR